jgi:hypothetical protein
MWYNIIPPFVPMDLHLYSMYYFGINGLGPLISKRKEIYATDTTQKELVSPVEPLEHTQDHARIPSFGLE